ncbi:MAG: oxidoreductase [Leptothrix sp. (in: Bacteria)]|nr:oxidoreductase [Leptothrix sp. (in: b-proteobacteria)]
MFSFFKKSGPNQASINGVPIMVNPKETLLQAALREGIDFPNSCRVGGCAACKCKLVDGKVKELTQTAYILSDEDLDAGMILACQSVPQTNVTIEVHMAAQQARRTVSGRVVACTALTHDIVSLRIQLDDSLPYKAGQYAQLSVDSLPGVDRSYSFATASQPNSQVSFLVRKVPNGVFSSHVHKHDLVGQRASVKGPMGDFWLRPSDAPLLMVAGGSGLAPVLAILEDALAQGVKRPVTILFGARQQADLYAQDTLEALRTQWPAAFRFVPVLSAEPDGSSWAGALGNVDSALAEHLPNGAHAYLCGPPVMVDAVSAVLRDRGIAKEQIRADRFTTLHDSTGAQ